GTVPAVEGSSSNFLWLPVISVTFIILASSRITIFGVGAQRDGYLRGHAPRACRREKGIA
ncbi:28038_t:CDS:2, partial [Racocetra persica]